MRHSPQAAASTSDAFGFAVKFPKQITHKLRLIDAMPALDASVVEVSPAGLRDRHQGPVALEPRHPTWFGFEPDAMLGWFKIARVLVDPVLHPAGAASGGWPGLACVRLHRRQHGRRRGSGKRNDAGRCFRIGSPLKKDQKMTLKISRRAMVATTLALVTLSGVDAMAQALPKVIKIVVAYPAGGVSDTVARALGDKLAAQLGATVVIENKAGASGTIGMDVVAKAAPDGATLGFSAISPLVLSPHLGKLPFDPRKDILPVASVMYSPVLLLATSASNNKDFKSLLADAKARPGAIRWATSGQASLGHITLEQLRLATGINVTHVPYKGGGQQMNDALGGQFEILSTNAGPILTPHIRSGKLRPLAVGAPARLTSLPNVPTLAELGFPAANLSSLFGVFAPAGLPPTLLALFNAEINKALASTDLRARLQATDNVATGGSAAAFAKTIAAEYESNGRVVKAANIQAD